MRTARVLAMLMLGWTLVACGPAPAVDRAAIPTRAIAIAAGQTVGLDVSSGRVRVRSSPGEAVEIKGQLGSPQHTDWRVSEDAGGVQVYARAWGAGDAAPGPPVELEVLVPAGTPLVVRTYDAAVELSGLQGRVEVRSTAGDISASNLHDALLQTARGDVEVRGGSGELRVVAEAGAVSLDALAGDVGATAIMGTIRYAGTLGPSDHVHLETDHGHIEVRLGRSSAVTAGIATTSGALTCLIPELRRTANGYSGTLGSGAGRLEVRTVSGAISISYLP